MADMSRPAPDPMPSKRRLHAVLVALAYALAQTQVEK